MPYSYFGDFNLVPPCYKPADTNESLGLPPSNDKIWYYTFILIKMLEIELFGRLSINYKIVSPFVCGILFWSKHDRQPIYVLAW